MSKDPLPGYGLAVIDKEDDDGSDEWDTPQTGELVLQNQTDKNRKWFDFEFLLNKKVYWKKYADADATFYDKELSQDVVFIELDKVVGYEG